MPKPQDQHARGKPGVKAPRHGWCRVWISCNVTVNIDPVINILSLLAGERSRSRRHRRRRRSSSRSSSSSSSRRRRRRRRSSSSSSSRSK